MTVRPMKRRYLIPVLYLLSGLHASASPLDDLWKDPAVESRIAAGIRANRMGDVVLTLTDAAGQPLPNVTVRIEQTRHAFLFGANIFMLGGFPTPEKNRQFEADLHRRCSIMPPCRSIGPTSNRSRASRGSPRTARPSIAGRRPTRWSSSASSTASP